MLATYLTSGSTAEGQRSHDRSDVSDSRGLRTATYAARVCRGCSRTPSPAGPGPRSCGRCCRFWRCQRTAPPWPSGWNSSECWSGTQTSSWWPAPEPEARRRRRSHLQPVCLDGNRNVTVELQKNELQQMLNVLIWMDYCLLYIFETGHVRLDKSELLLVAAPSCCQTSELHSACQQPGRWRSHGLQQQRTAPGCTLSF